MASSDPPAVGDVLHSEAPSQVSAQAQTEGEGKKITKIQEPVASGEGAKLSGAELKKQKQAEKAARRAQALQQKQTGPVSPAAGSAAGQSQKTEGAKNVKGPHKRGSPVAVDARNIPLRGSQKFVPVAEEPKKEDKTVEFFRHLYKTRTTSIAGASKEVHPAVLALGLQMSNYTICGSCARLVATLQAFKRVGDLDALISIKLTFTGYRILHNPTHEFTY